MFKMSFLCILMYILYIKNFNISFFWYFLRYILDDNDQGRPIYLLAIVGV